MKATATKRQAWYERLTARLGIEGAAGQSKHSRGRINPRHWRRKRRAARKQARVSRKRNRWQ